MIPLYPITVRNLDTGATMGPYDEDWDAIDAARESVHTGYRPGGGDHTATDFVLTDRQGRDFDRFQIDCDGQYFERDAQGNLIFPD